MIIQGIEGSQSSFGWVGYAYAEQNSGGVKLLEVDGGDGCIAPNRDTIADGSYPLSRALYIYVNTDKAKSNAALKGYVDFYMQSLGEAVPEAGYVDLPANEVTAVQQAWDGAAA